MPGRFSPGVLPWVAPRRPGIADALQEGIAAYIQLRGEQRDERNQMLQAGGVELDPSTASPMDRLRGLAGGRVGGLINRVTGATTLPETDAPDLARAKTIPADVPQPFVPVAMETPPGGVRPGVGLPASMGGGAAMPARGVANVLGGLLAPGGMTGGLGGGLRPTAGFNPNGGAVPGVPGVNAGARRPGVADLLGGGAGTSSPDGLPRGGYVLEGRGGARFAFDPVGRAAAAQAAALANLDAQEGIKSRYATALETAKAAAAATAAEKARQETFGQQTALANLHETAADRRARMAADAAREKSARANPMQSNRLLTAFDNDPSFKNAQQIAQSLSQLRAAANDPSAAGDIAVLTHYMKMIDPTSSVREGEFANAQNAASIPDRIRNQYNRAVSGQRLNPETRADFVRQAEGLANSQRNVFKGTVDRYSAMAQRAGIDPRDVVFDPYTTLDDPSAAPAAPAGPTDRAAAIRAMAARGMTREQIKAALAAGEGAR